MSRELKSADVVAAAVFHKISDLEDQVTAARDLFTAIMFMAEAMHDEGTGSITRLCGYGIAELKTIETVREDLFHETHRFVYAERAVAP